MTSQIRNNSAPRTATACAVTTLTAALALLAWAARPAEAQATCSCSTVGSFRAPTSSTVLDRALRSSDGRYRVDASVDNVAQLTSVAVVQNSTGTIVFQTTVRIAATWGFLRDGRTFVLSYAEGGGSDLLTWAAYDLTRKPARRVVGNTVSQVGFSLLASPSTRYLQEMAVTAPQYVELRLYDVGTSRLSYQTAFPVYAQAGSTKPTDNVTTGFGPNDASRPTFLVAHTVAPNATDWNVIDLTRGRVSVTSTTLAMSGYWSFSPCGDVIALVAQTSARFVETSLWDTSRGGGVGTPASFRLGPVELVTTSEWHLASSGGETIRLARNSACGSSAPAPGGGSGGGGTTPPLPVPGVGQSPRGRFETITSEGVAVGWAYDPGEAARSIQVHFYIDGPAGSGTFGCAVDASMPRADINAQQSIPGDHGFACQLPSQFADGNSHEVYAYGIDVTGNPNALLSNSPLTLLFNAPRERVEEFGTRDRADRVRWAVALDVAPPGTIEFRLCQRIRDGWGKWLGLPDRSEDLYVQGATCVSRTVNVARFGVDQEIRLAKAKFLGIKTGVKEVRISWFAPIPPRSRLTIEWLTE